MLVGELLDDIVACVSQTPVSDHNKFIASPSWA